MAEKLFRGIRGIRVNTSKKISFYTQTQRQAGRVLFILWLLASSSSSRTLAVPTDERVTEGSGTNSLPAVNLSQPESCSRPAAPVDLSNPASSSSAAASMHLQKLMSRKGVPDNKTLVAALNAVSPTTQCSWIQAAIEWFTNKKIETLGLAVLQDYAALAHVQMTSENKQLLKRYFDSLCNKVKAGSFGEKLLIQALTYVLAHINPHIFKDDPQFLLSLGGDPQPLLNLDGDPQPLLDLGTDLLAKLNPSQREFKQADYPSARATLEALSETLFLVHSVAPGHLNIRSGSLYQNFKNQLQEIIDKASYYPVTHQAILIQQTLHLLENKAPDQKDNIRRIAQGLLGVANLVTVGHGLAIGELKLAEFQLGIQLLKDAFKKKRIKPYPGHDQLLALKGKMLQCLQEQNLSAYPELQELEAIVQEIRTTSKLKQYRKTLRFGIAMQLQILALRGPTAEIRTNSIIKLIALSKQASAKEVRQGVFDSLLRVAAQSQEERAKEVTKAHNHLQSLADKLPLYDARQATMQKKRSKSDQDRADEAFSVWLSGETLNAKLERLKDQPTEQTPRDEECLFSQVRQDLRSDVITELLAACASPEERTAMRNTLVSYYKRTDFANVKSLFEEQGSKHVKDLECQFEEQGSKHVKDLECQLMLLAQQPVKQDQAAAGGSEHHVAKHHERRFEWVKTPIALKDLFKKRSVKPGAPAQEISRILLTGDPGTGKTTLSRQLAYLWSVKKWGQEFQAVYLLPFRNLQERAYDGTCYNRAKTLSTAIVNNCFAHALSFTKDEYNTLRAHIAQELKQPTTLVILDGLDERAGASEQILGQAQAGAHKLLMLSRPYGIEAERQIAQIEIEHVGFNRAQLEHYVRQEVSDSNQASELLSYINQQENICSIAHIPVNLQILCVLWQEKRYNVRKSARQGSLPTLYRLFTQFIWQRYIKRAPESVPVQERDRLFRQLGQIALCALAKGEVLITPGLINEALNSTDATNVITIGQNAGFLKCVANDTDRRYEFSHLTFQEYFAGCELARKLLSEYEPEQSEARELLSEHKYEPRYERTLSFMAGEGNESKGAEGTKKLLKLLGERKREIMGLQHLLLQLRVVHEWLCVAFEQQVKGSMENLENEFGMMDSLKKWFLRAFMHVRLEGYTEGLPGYSLLGVLKNSLQTFRSIPKHAPWLSDLFDQTSHEDQEPNASVRLASRSALGKMVIDLGLQEADEQESDVAAPEAVAQPPRALFEQLHQVPKAAKLITYADILKTFRASLLQAVTMATSQKKFSELLDQLRQVHKDAKLIAYDHIRKSLRASLLQAATAATSQKKFSKLLELLRQAVGDTKPTVYADILKTFRACLIQAVTDATSQEEFNKLLEQLRQPPKNAKFVAYDTPLKSFQASLFWAVNDATSQEEFSKLLELLRQAAEDAQLVAYDALLESFRASLLQAVNDATSQEEFSTLLELLLQAAQDRDRRLRVIASEAFLKAPLEKLLEHYWPKPDAGAQPDTRLIPYITPRLYHTSLVVSPSIRSGYDLQVTLYTAAGQPRQWEKPKTVVKNFQEYVKREIEQLSQVARLPASVDALVWNTYLGKVGKEPVLPDDLALDRPCPFWKGKKVKDTHLLVLIPSHVAGQKLTFDSLMNLIEQQCQGVSSEKNNLNYWKKVRAAIGHENITKTEDPDTSYWVLMTRWAIPGTRWKESEEQRELVANHAARTGLPYQVPGPLETLVMMFMQTVRSSNNDAYPAPNDVVSGTAVSRKLVSPHALPQEPLLITAPSAALLSTQCSHSTTLSIRTSNPSVSTQPSACNPVASQPSDRNPVASQPSDRKPLASQPSNRKPLSTKLSDRTSATQPSTRTLSTKSSNPPLATKLSDRTSATQPSNPPLATKLSDRTSATQLSDPPLATKLSDRTSATQLSDRTSATKPSNPTLSTKLSDRTSATQPSNPTLATQLSDRTSATQLSDRTSATQPSNPPLATKLSDRTSATQPSNPPLSTKLSDRTSATQPSHLNPLPTYALCKDLPPTSLQPCALPSSHSIVSLSSSHCISDRTDCAPSHWPTSPPPCAESSFTALSSTGQPRTESIHSIDPSTGRSTGSITSPHSIDPFTSRSTGSITSPHAIDPSTGQPRTESVTSPHSIDPSTGRSSASSYPYPPLLVRPQQDQDATASKTSPLPGSIDRSIPPTFPLVTYYGINSLGPSQNYPSKFPRVSYPSPTASLLPNAIHTGSPLPGSIRTRSTPTDSHLARPLPTSSPIPGPPIPGSVSQLRRPDRNAPKPPSIP